MHRARDVPKLLLAEVAEGEIELAGGVLLHPPRDADAARLGQGFKAGGDIDPIAEDVAVFLNDDVALMDADAPVDAALRRGARVLLGHLGLDVAGAAQRINSAAKLREEPRRIGSPARR